MTRIVVFGATGFTGRLVTLELVARGLRPLLAGRSPERLRAMASEHGGLEIAVAEVARPEALRGLLEPGDVLVSAVGPFLRYGETAVAAAVEARAHYIDSSGEAAFIRRVFCAHGPRAEHANVVLLPACGYNFAPGNLAGALCLRDAGSRARRVDVGYFFTGPVGGWSFLAGSEALSDGSHATLTMADSHAHGYRGGRWVLEPFARRVRRFEDDGRWMPALSVGATEHFTLPRIAPQLDEVNVYLGWFRGATRPLQLAARLRPLSERSQRVRAWMDRRTDAALAHTGRGPDAAERAHSGSLFLARAKDAEGRQLAMIRLTGPNGYDLTAQLMSFAAERLAMGDFQRVGALGPVDAFGIEALEAAWPTVAGGAVVSGARRLRPDGEPHFRSV